MPYFAPYKVTQIEIDFGTTPSGPKTFTVTDASVLSTSNVMAEIAYVAPTGKSLDELEFDPMTIRCNPSSGSFTMYVEPLHGPVSNKFKINYIVG